MSTGLHYATSSPVSSAQRALHDHADSHRLRYFFTFLFVCLFVWKVSDAASKRRSVRESQKQYVFMLRKRAVLSIHLFQGTALVIPEMHRFGMPITPLFFPLICIKENPCIINELGKHFQNYIDLQPKSDLYFITGGKSEEMLIFMNKVTRFASVLGFQKIFFFFGVS